jgi:hypothetical protein
MNLETKIALLNIALLLEKLSDEQETLEESRIIHSMAKIVKSGIPDY